MSHLVTWMKNLFTIVLKLKCNWKSRIVWLPKGGKKRRGGRSTEKDKNQVEEDRKVKEETRFLYLCFREGKGVLLPKIYFLDCGLSAWRRPRREFFIFFFPPKWCVDGLLMKLFKKLILLSKFFHCLPPFTQSNSCINKCKEYCEEKYSGC